MNEDAGTASSGSIWSCAILVVRYSGGVSSGMVFWGKNKKIVGDWQSSKSRDIQGSNFLRM
jgi:hypothetical protein